MKVNKMQNRAELNSLKESFATILYSVIISDDVISQEEREKFNRFFKNEFSMSTDESKKLFEKVCANIDEVDTHISKLKISLDGHPMEKARFMSYLNECIICDGIDDKEYDEFDRVRSKLFS